MEGLLQTETGAVYSHGTNEETGQIDILSWSRSAQLPYLWNHEGGGTGLTRFHAINAYCATLLYYATTSWLVSDLFALLMVVSPFSSGAACSTSRWALWALLLSFPLPYIANTAAG